MSRGRLADRRPRPFPPAGDRPHALHAGFRPSRHAPAPRTRKLRLLRQFRQGSRRGGRALLRRQHRTPPRQLPQVGTQTPAPHAQSRIVPGLRHRHCATRTPALRHVQAEGPRGQPRPQTAAAQRAEKGRHLPALWPERPRRRQDQLRGLPCRPPPGSSRPCGAPAPTGRPLDLHRMRQRTSRSRAPPLCRLPAAHGKAGQGGRQTPPGSTRRRRPLCRLRTALGRSRSHGLQSLPRRLAGPLQPQGA